MSQQQQTSPSSEDISQKVNNELLKLLQNVQRASPVSSNQALNSNAATPEALYTAALNLQKHHQVAATVPPSNGNNSPRNVPPPNPLNYIINSSQIFPTRRDTPVPEEVLQGHVPQATAAANPPARRLSAQGLSTLPPVATFNQTRQPELSNYQQEPTASASPAVSNVAENSNGSEAQQQEDGNSQQIAQQTKLPLEQYSTILYGNEIDYLVKSNPLDRLPIQKTTITLYNSEMLYHYGTTIATNDSYMAYGIKGGLVRVINKFTAKRALLKGHKQIILDIKFVPNQDKLATISKDKTLIIWDITHEEKKEELTYTYFFYLKPSLRQNEQLSFKRIEWNPLKQYELVAVSNTNEIFAIDFAVLLASNERTAAFSKTLPGVTVLKDSQEGEPVNDIAFSRDGKYLVASNADGTLTFWTAQDYKCLASAQVLDRPICSIRFLGSKQYPNYNNLIVAGPNNADFTIVKFNETANGVRVKRVQTVTFKTSQNSESPFLNHIDVDESSSFLLAANMQPSNFTDSNAQLVERSALFALHLQPSGESFTFDFLAELDSEQPIISFSTESKMQSDNKVSPHNVLLGLFCLQASAIQLLNIAGSDIYPSVPPKLPQQKQPTPPSTPQQDNLIQQLLMSQQQAAAEESQQPAMASAADIEASLQLLSSAPASSTEPQPINHFNEQQILQEVQGLVQASQPNINSTFQTGLPQVTTHSNADLAQLEVNLVNRMAHMLEHFSAAQFARLEQKFEMERQERLLAQQKRDAELAQVLSYTLANEIPDNIENVVQQVFEERVIPNITAAIGAAVENAITKSFPDQIKKSMDQAVPRIERTVNESLKRSLNDSVANAITSVIEPKIKESFQSSLKNSVIPSFSQSCKVMFDQISNYLDRFLEERVKKPLEDYTQKLNEQTMQSLDQKLKLAVAEIQSMAVANKQATPQQAQQQQQKKQKPKQTPHEVITQLLAAQKYEQAITSALQEEDLALVVWTISQMDPAAVLSNPEKKISQAVLLSLIQQVSYDMSADIELKVQWLSQILLVLDVSDNTIKKHVPSILSQALESVGSALKAVSANQPNLAKQCVLLMHVLNSIRNDASSKK